MEDHTGSQRQSTKDRDRVDRIIHRNSSHGRHGSSNRQGGLPQPYCCHAGIPPASLRPSRQSLHLSALLLADRTDPTTPGNACLARFGHLNTGCTADPKPHSRWHIGARGRLEGVRCDPQCTWVGCRSLEGSCGWRRRISWAFDRLAGSPLFDN